MEEEHKDGEDEVQEVEKEEEGLKRRRSSKRRTYKQDGSLAGVQDSQLLVLAGGEDSGSVPAPAGAVDHVGVDAVDPHHGLATGHVPQDDHVIAAWGWGTGGRSYPIIVSTRSSSRTSGLSLTCTQQHVVGGGVPAQGAHPLGVSVQFDHRLGEGRRQPAVGDLPDLSSRGQRTQAGSSETTQEEGGAVR